MSTSSFAHRRATDPATLERLFGSTDVLPLWIAEPTLPPPQEVSAVMQSRAQTDFFGYEIRPHELRTAFWSWMEARHGWAGDGTKTSFSPSVGATFGTVIELVTEVGDRIILQPPVFTDFKPAIRRSRREPLTNPLVLDRKRYGIDLEHLAKVASDPASKLLVLCNPHNPVGRTWTRGELAAVAVICAENDVAVFADEVHGDLALFDGEYVPFGSVEGAGAVRWLSSSSPIKSFGLAGVADTMAISNDEHLTTEFRRFGERFHLVRNHVFGVAASIAAYQVGGPWIDEFRGVIEGNVARLAEGLPEPLSLVPTEATYLAWIDFRGLGLDVPELSRWLVDEARLALSPGHWFGREGAGFGRMTIASPPWVIDDAVSRLGDAVARLS
ncbi:MAG: MalY/PatB family protein [Acidimicrobiia bacterium]